MPKLRTKREADWLPIAALPGLEVSNEGRVRDTVTKRSYSGSTLHPYFRYQGTFHHVARLVLEAFDPTPHSDASFVVHKNHNPRDCRLSNLKWACAVSLSEQWRPVPEYEGLYEISDHGRLRSCDRAASDTIGRVQRREGVLRRASGNGFLLSKNGHTSYHRVDALVFEAFLGEKPDRRLIHLNGVLRDNRLCNLARSPTPSTPQSPNGDHHEHQHPDDPA